MKQAPLHSKKFWINTQGVAIPRELCNDIIQRRKKPSGQPKATS
jgi:hypothetical protein